MGVPAFPANGKKYKCEYAKSEPGEVKRGHIMKEEDEEDEGSELLLWPRNG